MDSCCANCEEKFSKLFEIVEDLKSEINFLKSEINFLKSEINFHDEKKFYDAEKFHGDKKISKIYKNKNNFEEVIGEYKSYKNPVLDFITTEMMVSLFHTHTEKLPYILFRYIYFTSEPPENRSIKMPKSGAVMPKLLEVCDYGEWHKVLTHEVIVEVNKIVCGLINTYLTKGAVYMGLELSDKKLIADMACRRMDKKLNNETIKNYISALY